MFTAPHFISVVVMVGIILTFLKPPNGLVNQFLRILGGAGRCVSSDRLANSALRVQASCMAMGQAAGAIAALAVQAGIPVHSVPLTSIRESLTKHGAIVPGGG